METIGLDWKFCKYCGSPIELQEVESLDEYNTLTGKLLTIQKAVCNNTNCPNNMSEEETKVQDGAEATTPEVPVETTTDTTPAA